MSNIKCSTCGSQRLRLPKRKAPALTVGQEIEERDRALS